MTSVVVARSVLEVTQGERTPEEAADFEAKKKAFENSARKVTESVTSNLLTALALFLAADLSGYLGGHGNPFTLIFLGLGAVMSIQLALHVVVPMVGGLYPRGWWVGGLAVIACMAIVWVVLDFGWPF